MTMPNALVVRDAVVTIDDEEYADQVKKARIVPAQSVQTYKTSVPDGVYQDFGTPTWNFELEGIQDNGTGGLAKALRDAVGTVIECVIQPKSGTGQAKATFSVRVPSVPFGWEEAGSFMDMDLTLPVIGQPVFGTSS